MDNHHSRSFVRLSVLLCILLAVASCSDPVQPPPPPTTEYYVYAISAYPDYNIYKIDATADSVVDSLHYTDGVGILKCSSDGRHLWAIGHEKTSVINTSTMTVERELIGHGNFEPIFIQDSEEILCVGPLKIFYLDARDFSVTYEDTTLGLLFDRVMHFSNEHKVAGKDFRRWQEGFRNRYLFYDYSDRKLADSIDLIDQAQSPFFNNVVSSPRNDLFFGFVITGLYSANWMTFDRFSGQALTETPFYSVGNFIFVRDGKEVIITDPGDCHGDVPYGVLFKFDIVTYSLVDTLSIRGLGPPGAPADFVLNCDEGVEVPGSNKAYITCSGGCQTGPILVVDTSPLSIRRVIFQNSRKYLYLPAIGRKP